MTESLKPIRLITKTDKEYYFFVDDYATFNPSARNIYYKKHSGFRFEVTVIKGCEISITQDSVESIEYLDQEKVEIKGEN